MKIFLLLIIFLLSCKSVPDSKPSENPEDKTLSKKWIVVPESGLNLRDAPSRKAKSVWLLPRGTRVTHKQLPENEKIDTIEDQKGKWLKVEVGNESGWVFDVYLSEPVFSPNGDKFYFVTVKDLTQEKILNLDD
ncbi:MAG: SH3 domain-containing protein [Leptospiraceae bacterium]|nr:SH3 domain-containing protein [Leptospiraceae bacterium]